MKAFLSHSSQDKGVVAVVAKQLGSTQIEYDEYTFEYTLSADTIRRALARSTMFVLFLSANSIKSPFVAEELRTALEKRAGGMIESIMIFALDHTSYKEMPEWLREINVVQHLSNPKTIARKIQASLLALQTKIDRDNEA
ncbi:toll/interleukin-1 receptor domain-containing protein [Bradyrhizobium embrapense]